MPPQTMVAQTLESLRNNNILLVQNTATDDADIAAGVIPIQLDKKVTTNATTASMNGIIDNFRGSLDTSSNHSSAGTSTSTCTSHNSSSECVDVHVNNYYMNKNNTTETSAMAGCESRQRFNHDILAVTSSALSTASNKEYIQVLGINISHLSRRSQFIALAFGVFSFSLLYGYLQELISVSICNRQLGLFLAMSQFLGYTIWSKIFHLYVQSKEHKRLLLHQTQNQSHCDDINYSVNNNNANNNNHHPSSKKVSFRLYLLLSILRAIDAGMTNMAMAYVNYPAKTLMKSSRVVFTMLFGILIRRKKYKPIDYLVVTFMVTGLALFMHADSKSSAIFQPIGIVMLTTSLLCDGAINNMSEAIMIQYNIGQDEFIYNLYSIATCGLIMAASIRGDLNDGFTYLTTPGTWDEIQSNSNERSWNVTSKIMVLILFSSTGFFGSSCSALITKEFGALTMSITSTARKAMTLFLSFALFNNVCTVEHVSGILLFIIALVAKSLRISKSGSGGGGKRTHNGKGHDNGEDDNGISVEITPLKNNIHVEETPSPTNSRERRSAQRLRRRREHIVANIV